MPTMRTEQMLRDFCNRKNQLRCRLTDTVPDARCNSPSTKLVHDVSSLRPSYVTFPRKPGQR